MLKIVKTSLIIASILMVLLVSIPSAYAQSPSPTSTPTTRRDQIKDKIKEKIVSNPDLLKIFKSGRIAIGSGEITAISGTTLTVRKDDKDYTVLTDENTKFRRKYWGKSELSEFSVGDKVNVIGTWEDEAKTTVRAHLVRNLSIQMRHGVFIGTVTIKDDNGFTMDTVKRGNQTVTVNSETKYTNRKEETISFDDIQVGHRVRVRGLWNSRTSTITEVDKVKDFSLPPRPTPAGSPVPSPSAE